MTASEFLYDKAGDYLLMSKSKVEKLLIEFAQHHVGQALKEASKKAYRYSRSESVLHCSCSISKESILTAYPKENIQ